MDTALGQSGFCDRIIIEIAKFVSEVIKVDAWKTNMHVQSPFDTDQQTMTQYNLICNR